MFNDLRFMKNIILRRPILCLWQVTARCNFTCRICPFWREEYSADEELSLAEIEAAVRSMRPIAPLMVSLAGGEPLLRDDLPGIVRAVSERNYCSVITNGWYMTRETAKHLFDSGMRDCMVSLDYATPEPHDAQRGVMGAFVSAVRALEFLRDARPSAEHKVRMLTVLMDDNLGEIEGLILIAEELSVSLAVTLYSDHLGRLPDRRPRGPVSEYLVELKRRHARFDSAESYLSSFDRALGGGVSGCGGGRTFININHRGMVSRCVDRYDRPLADIRREPLNSIFDALAEESARDQCRHCWTSCRGVADVITGVQGIRSYPDFLRSRRSIPL